MTVFLFCVVAAAFLGVGIANEYDRKYGKLSPRRYDVLPQDDPPVAAPFPGEPTGS